jgi:hypothetical protein
MTNTIKREQRPGLFETLLDVSILRTAKKWLYIAMLLPALLISCDDDENIVPEPEEEGIDWNEAANLSSMSLPVRSGILKESGFSMTIMGKLTGITGRRLMRWTSLPMPGCEPTTRGTVLISTTGMPG